MASAVKCKDLLFISSERPADCPLCLVGILCNKTTRKDTSFLEDLLDHYERGVHGNREDGAGFLNDQMFFDLCNRLTTYVVQTNENPDIASASSIFPPDIVFEAIGQVFIDKGNTHELKAKYGDILLKQDKKLNKSLHQSGSTFEEHFSNPDIEGKDAVSATAEQSLHSFTSLFCRRCYKYDCYLHPYGSVNPDLYPRKNDLKVEGPCGPQCSLWFVVTAKNSKLKKSSSCENLAVSNTPADLSPSPSFSSLSAATNSDCDSIRIPCRRGIHASTSNENGHKGDNNNNNNSEEKTYWSPADQSMFRVYASVFGDNCCAIAASLGDKSCKEVSKICDLEVHDFALKDELCQKIAKRKSNEQNRVKSKRLTHRDWMRKYSKVAALKDIDGALKVNTTSSYVPCSHEGVCSEQKNCACIERSPNRFPGCRCKAHCDTKQCPCFLAVRECDPDLCPSCGAADFASLNDAVASSSSSEDLAPSTPYSSDKPRCNNVNIQRGLKKRLLLAPSQVAGWGIYLKEAVEKNTFIAEYCGELISQDEAERRGKVYDRHMCSFLFNLNQDLVVDATRKGNKIRFANHSVNPNCVAKVMMVNGDHRIGIFSRCAIAEDEELFFDYRYGPLEQLKFVGIEHKRKPAQKSTVG
uniref:[histone H3]-lysine(27) N-trimethyltransferase n=1 Tax=Romanomermis culicivorax TaxID=13658 RepID=A0A915I056_ROMCU